MINTNPSLMPLDEVVPAIRQLLPLRADTEPALAIHEAFFNLLGAGHPSVVSEQKLWLHVFVVELLTTELPKESLRSDLLAYVKSQYAANKPEIDAILQSCVLQGKAPAETAELFHSALNA